MIELFTFKTGNGWRASIALEECGLPYRSHKIDFAKGEQNRPAFLRINPLGKIPVIVDPEGPGGRAVTISQSGAILLYCAEKSGRFVPSDPIARVAALQWMILAVSDGSDIVGGVIRMSRLTSEPGVVAYKKRLVSLFDCVEAHLAGRQYLVDDISIADLAFYPVAAHGRQLVSIEGLPHLKRWFETMSARPGIARGMTVPD